MRRFFSVGFGTAREGIVGRDAFCIPVFAAKTLEEKSGIQLAPVSYCTCEVSVNFLPHVWRTKPREGRAEHALQWYGSTYLTNAAMQVKRGRSIHPWQ